MGIKQLPLEYQADAMAAVEQRNAEVAARTREPEGEDGSIPSHADWPRLGAA